MNARTRRHWLGLFAAAVGSGVFSRWARGTERPVPAVNAVDHLLLGVSDLDRGIAWLENRTGVKAAAGGSHPGVGTRNALAALGSRRYLEIIAPDPAQTSFNFRIDLRKLSEPRLITWAAGTKDIEAVAERMRGSGLESFGPKAGSRARPDGRVLRWKTFGVKSELAAGIVDPIPFFIEWAADSIHPSQDSPGGCELLAFEIEHPKPTDLRNLFEKFGIEANVKPGDRVRLAATLRSPKGTIRLT